MEFGFRKIWIREGLDEKMQLMSIGWFDLKVALKYQINKWRQV